MYIMANRQTRSEEDLPPSPTSNNLATMPLNVPSPQGDILLVSPVRATPIAANAAVVPHDIPAVRMFLHPAGTTVAVYPP